MSELPLREGIHRREGPQTWADQDVFTEWRKLYCYTQRPGVTKSVKRAFNRRRRRAVNRALRNERSSKHE